MDDSSAVALIASAVTVLTQAGYRVERLGIDLWRITSIHAGAVRICLTSQVVDLADAVERDA